MALHDCYQLFHGTFMFFLDLNPQPNTHLLLLKRACEMWMCADESLCNISVEAADRVPADAACLLNAGLCGPLALAALEMTCRILFSAWLPAVVFTGTHQPFPNALWTQRRVQKRSLNVEQSTGLSILHLRHSFYLLCKTLKVNQNLSRTLYFILLLGAFVFISL